MEFSKYCAQKGGLSRDQPKDMSASTWWSGVSTCPGLRQVAMRIARLRSSSANIERTFSKLKWFQGDRRGNLSIETLTHLGRIKIFEGYDDDKIVEPKTDKIDQYSPHNQYVLENDLDLSFDLEDAAEFKSGSMQCTPELFDDETRCIWDEFNRYIDFSTVNKLIVDTDESEPDLSDEQMDKLLEECQEMRKRVRHNQTKDST